MFNNLLLQLLMKTFCAYRFIVSMLFHLGAMQWLIMKIGWVLKVSTLESKIKMIVFKG